MTRRVNTDRRQSSPRRAEDLSTLQKEGVALIDELRMQARTHCSANRIMRVQPTQVERFPEWRAADMIEKLLKEVYNG